MQFKLFNTLGDGYAQYLAPAWQWLVRGYAQQSAGYLYSARPTSAFLHHRLADQTATWENPLPGNLLGYLVDHQVDGAVVLPGAAYVEIGLEMHRELFLRKTMVIQDLKFQKLLTFDDGDNTRLQFAYEEEGQVFNIYGKHCGDDASWVKHASGKLATAEFAPVHPVALAQWQQRCREQVDVEQLYRRLWQRGLQYGPCFRNIRQLWRQGMEVLARIEIQHASLGVEGAHCLHPALLDACFQSLTAIQDLDESDAHLYLPVRVGRICYHANPKGRVWCHGQIKKRRKGGIEADLTLCDDNGTLLVEIEKLSCLRARPRAASATPQSTTSDVPVAL